MKISSPAFQNNTQIPTVYTCDGQGINPPLFFSDVPANAKSLVLIVEDPDAPMGTFVHWILFNLDPKTTQIEENSIPQGAKQGKTSMNKIGYVGACPPSGTHRYVFKLYALDEILKLEVPDRNILDNAIRNHILEKTELVGFYQRI